MPASQVVANWKKGVSNLFHQKPSRKVPDTFLGCRMTPLVAYLLLFVAVGAGFIFVHLVVGKLIRPSKPGAEKLTIYECGEPTIGTAWVQFDLRFYVVALLFVIFDVEVAFFFPWAEVFGRANAVRLVSVPPEGEALKAYGRDVRTLTPPHQSGAVARYAALTTSTREGVKANAAAASRIAWLALVDILVFFGVLLVGFAYLWKRGDLAWVRSLAAERAAPAEVAAAPEAPPALAGAGARS